MPFPKLNKREKTCVGIMGVGAAALLIASGLSNQGSYLFNPEAAPLRRALAIPIRGLNLAITGYDTSQDKVLPAFYDHIANVWDTLTPDDQVMMWYIPRAGGNTFGKIIGKCLGMVTCSGMAATVTNGLLPSDHMTVKHDDSIGSFINVDLSTYEGITKAISYNVVPSNQADVLITHHLQNAAAMFSAVHKGRLFALLRHPIKRTADNFYYRQRATWEPTFDPDLAAMSIEEFAVSDRLIENFVVRSLVGKVTVDVTKEDVELAKDILRRKFIIGISEPTWYELSIVRLEKYFGWWDDMNVLGNVTVNYCHHHEITMGNHFGNYPRVLPDSEAYNKIAVRNWADIELYMYAKNALYKEQSVLV